MISFIFFLSLLTLLSPLPLSLSHPPLPCFLQLYWFLCVWLCHVLLLQAFTHVRYPPDGRVFWLHYSLLLHLLPHDRHSFILRLPHVCQIHLQESQNGLDRSTTPLTVLSLGSGGGGSSLL